MNEPAGTVLALKNTQYCQPVGEMGKGICAGNAATSQVPMPKLSAYIWPCAVAAEAVAMPVSGLDPVVMPVISGRWVTWRLGEVNGICLGISETGVTQF